MNSRRRRYQDVCIANDRTALVQISIDRSGLLYNRITQTQNAAAPRQKTGPFGRQFVMDVLPDAQLILYRIIDGQC